MGVWLGVSGADIMLCHSSITYIDLGYNSIGDVGVEKFVEHSWPTA